MHTPQRRPKQTPRGAPPPMLIGPYVLGDRDGDVLSDFIGRGGTADVYRVRCSLTGAHLALKLQAMVTSTRAVARFMREYQLLSELDHPAVPRGYDFGQLEDGRYFLVMELIDGMSGRDWIKTTGAPGSTSRNRAAVWCAAEVLSLLIDLHGHGLIHGDIKPSNLVIEPSGRLRVLDLGGARDALAPMPWVRPGRFFGTYGYAPVEQLQMQTLDGRADLHALGATLFRLLSGRARDPVKDREAALAALALDHPTLAQVTPEVPLDLSRLVADLMAVQRDDRIESAAAALSRLQACATQPQEPQEPPARPVLPASPMPPTPDETAETAETAEAADLRTLVSRGDLQLASEQLMALIDADNATVWIAGLAEVWALWGLHSLALALVEAAFEDDRTAAEKAALLLARAHLDLDLGRHNAATRLLDYAARLNPAIATNHVYWRGRARAARAVCATTDTLRLGLASDAVRAGLNLADTAVLDAYLGEALVRCGRLEEARDLLKNSLIQAQAAASPLAMARVVIARTLAFGGSLPDLPESLTEWLGEVPLLQFQLAAATATATASSSTPSTTGSTTVDPQRAIDDLLETLEPAERQLMELMPWVARIQAKTAYEGK